MKREGWRERDRYVFAGELYYAIADIRHKLTIISIQAG